MLLRRLYPRHRFARMTCRVLGPSLSVQCCSASCSSRHSWQHTVRRGWLSSRVVSVLDSGAEGPGFKSQPRRCRVTVLGKLFIPIVHQAAKLVAALLRAAGVTADLAESNGSLPPGLWLTSPVGWLPRTGICSGTLRSVIAYGLPFYRTTKHVVHDTFCH